MKFILSQISAIFLAATAVSAAAYKRDGSDSSNSVASAYPNGTDAGVLNGTWYLTGLSQNAYSMWESLSQQMNLTVNCLQLNASSSGNTTLNGFASAFLNHNGSSLGVNASAATAWLLQQPDSNVNTSNHELLWTAYGSQVFVNSAQWDNFTTNGQSTQNASNSGSQAISGTEPFEATIYSSLIDSTKAAGDNSSTNFDTIFIWGTTAQTFDANNLQKRDSAIYGAILSKTSSVSEDTFNKTLALLPPTIAQNNVSLVLLNDTCHGNSTNN